MLTYYINSNLKYYNLVNHRIFKFVILTLVIYLLQVGFLHAKKNTPDPLLPNEEYFKPISPPGSFLKNKEREKESNVQQYQGDHSFLWYRKNQDIAKFYINFNLSYSLYKDVENLSINHVGYPDATNSEGQLGYKGTLEGNGALGFGLAFGYQKKNFLRYEIDIASHRARLTNVKSASFTNKVITSGYTETGPEIIEEKNDSFTITPIMFNIILNLSKNKIITPYIGGGMGYAFIGVTKEYDIHPAKQFKFGFNYRLSEKMNFNIGYRKVMMDNIKYVFKTSKTNTADTRYNNREYVFEHSQDMEVFTIGYKFEF